jgi:hypothetical protein
LSVRQRPWRYPFSRSSILFLFRIPWWWSSSLPIYRHNLHLHIIRVICGSCVYMAWTIVCIICLLFWWWIWYVYEWWIAVRLEPSWIFSLFEYCGTIALIMSCINIIPFYPCDGFGVLSQWKILSITQWRLVSLVISLSMGILFLFFFPVIQSVYQVSWFLFDIVYIGMSHLFY